MSRVPHILEKKIYITEYFETYFSRGNNKQNSPWMIHLLYDIFTTDNSPPNKSPARKIPLLKSDKKSAPAPILKPAPVISQKTVNGFFVKLEKNWKDQVLYYHRTTH